MNGDYYDIIVKGHIDKQKSGWFGNLEITLLPQGRTLISGLVTDQAALHAVLSKIRDLGLTLLIVSRNGEK